MRHRKNFNHLGRKTGHRKSMLANMASSLILHKRIQTTTAKAKALRIYVEPLITKSKEDSTHSRRVVFSQLQNKEAVTELFREVSPKITERPGGYTRILKTGTRVGDNADMCVIELVDYNENLLTAKDEAAAKSGRRRRRGGKKKATDSASQVEETAVNTIGKESEVDDSITEKPADESPQAESEVADTSVEEVSGETDKKVESSEKENKNITAEKVEAKEGEDNTVAQKESAEVKEETKQGSEENTIVEAKEKAAETDTKIEDISAGGEIEKKVEDSGEDTPGEKKKEE